MKKILSCCDDCGESKEILTQVSCTVEVTYLCSDCYKVRYTKEVRDEIEKEEASVSEQEDTETTNS